MYSPGIERALHVAVAAHDERVRSGIVCVDRSVHPLHVALMLARWGLVPHWSREPRTKYSTINARAETVAEKPSYRDAFKHKRCLIPATGFYEWQRDGGNKTPHHIHAPGNSLLAFAGLWDHWDRQGDGFDSCSIIVTAASSIMQPSGVHGTNPL